MSINFPNNPTVGQTFEAEGLSFIWTGEVWAFNDGTGVVTNGVPRGGIIMWSGAINAVPTGWALCDGSNGTPDLIDRFIVAAGGAYAVGDTGGADTVTLTEDQLPAHDHTAGSLAAASGGGHSHAYYQGASHAVVPSSGTVTRGYLNGSATEVTRQTDVQGAHTHSMSGATANAGGGQAHENRPPYLALAYIMKT
jgi:microcystin-dependent protein